MSRALTTTLAILLVSACGARVKDKDANNDNPIVVDETNNSTTGTNGAPNNTNRNNATNSSNNPTNSSSNNSTNNPNNSTNNPTNSTNNPTNNPPNNPPGCRWDQTFFGQIGGTDDHGGGVPTPAPPSRDAGLADVLAAVPPTPDDFSTFDVDEGYTVLTTPIFVDGAIVTATGPNTIGNRRFWVEDRSGSLQVFLESELLDTVRVGDEVEFEVTALQNFEGHPQIAALQSFFIVNRDNAVPYRDANSRAITPDDYGHIVRLAGTLGAPYDCGGTNCYDFTYPGGMATLRSRSTIARQGSCVNYAGPVYSFPGPLQSDMTPVLQLDTVNFDWMWID